MHAKFAGLVPIQGAAYGGYVARFDRSPFNRDGFRLDLKNTMMRRHLLDKQGLDISEESVAIAEFQRRIDPQHWQDAERDFEEWLQS